MTKFSIWSPRLKKRLNLLFHGSKNTVQIGSTFQDETISKFLLLLESLKNYSKRECIILSPKKLVSEKKHRCRSGSCWPLTLNRQDYNTCFRWNSRSRPPSRNWYGTWPHWTRSQIWDRARETQARRYSRSNGLHLSWHFKTQLLYS